MGNKTIWFVENAKKSDVLNSSYATIVEWGITDRMKYLLGKARTPKDVERIGRAANNMLTKRVVKDKSLCDYFHDMDNTSRRFKEAVKGVCR